MAQDLDPVEEDEDAVEEVPADQLGDKEEEIMLEEKPRRPGPKLTREIFTTYMIEEKDRVINCSTMPCTILLFATFAAVVWLHGNVSVANHQRSAIYDAISRVKATHSYADGVSTSLQFYDIADTSEFWSWVGNGLVPLLSGSSSEDKPKLQGFNLLIGGQAMMKQRRVVPGSCRVEDNLAKYYGQDCFKTYGPIMNPDEPISRDPFGIMPYAGQDAAFLIGGGLSEMTLAEAEGMKRDSRFFSWLDAVRPPGSQKAPGVDRCSDLFLAGWIDDATTDVEIQAAFLNPEVGFYTHLKLRVEFERGGLTAKYLNVKPLGVEVFTSIAVVFIDIIWAVCMVILFVNTLQEWVDSKRRGCLNKVLGDPWLGLDCLASLWGTVFIIFFLLFILELGKLETKLTNIPTEAPMDPALAINASAIARTRLVTERREYRSTIAVMLYYLEWCSFLQEYNRLGMFWFVSAIMVRFFRGFAAQPRISTIGRTILRSGQDVFHLGMILLVVFGNFVMGGCILFGPELEAWSTAIKAGRSTFAVVWGSGNWYEMHEVMPMSAILWLFCFIVAVVFILNNIFIAVIIYFHAVVQDEQGGNEGQSLLRQLMLLIDDWWWSTSYKIRVVYRFLYKRLPDFYTRNIKPPPPEDPRVSKIPFDKILANLGVPGYEDTEGIRSEYANMLPHEYVTITFLMNSGCDKTTANRLFEKCLAYNAGLTPDTYPVSTLSHEFENAMEKGYFRIDYFREEMCNWLLVQHEDYHNMLIRQRKEGPVIPQPGDPGYKKKGRLPYLGGLDWLAKNIGQVEFTPQNSVRFDRDELGGESQQQAAPAIANHYSGSKGSGSQESEEDEDAGYADGVPRALAPS
jgi:hypothetical protein